MGGFDTDEITEELFESFVKSSNFVLDGVKKVFFKCQKIGLKCDSPR